MAIKKSELYGSIWKSCDELRGGMDASQYKDYVLILWYKIGGVAKEEKSWRRFWSKVIKPSMLF